MKRVSREIIEKYYTRLTLDFHTNKRICDEIAQIPSKKLRNKIAGFITHLMKRIQVRVLTVLPNTLLMPLGAEQTGAVWG